MKNLIIPQGYESPLNRWQTERAIKFIKDNFQRMLSAQLKLRRITAPLVVASGTGLNDNLSGWEAPVSFSTTALDGRKAEIVQSLAKWKRYALWKHEIAPGKGIYTDMNAIRPDEVVDNTHSLYVDQWDWEKVISKEERNETYLKEVVKAIYKAIVNTEFLLSEAFPQLQPRLPEKIQFIHAEELRLRYPELDAKERENAIAKEYGAVFIQGIGGALGDGTIHDVRSPDYDDWYTETAPGKRGLNGDILVWNDKLQSAFELSSMGIRVDAPTLQKQLEIAGALDRSTLLFHSLLLEDKLPLSIGGGIGQSRLCMLLLQKAHIGEVQAGIWPEEMIDHCYDHNINLL